MPNIFPYGLRKLKLVQSQPFQYLKVQTITAVIKAKFRFFQIQIKGGGYAVKLVQPEFDVTPERFNALGATNSFAS